MLCPFTVNAPTPTLCGPIRAMNNLCLPMENMLYIFNTLFLKSTFCNLVPLSISFLSFSLPFCLPLPSEKIYTVEGQNNLYSIMSLRYRLKATSSKCTYSCSNPLYLVSLMVYTAHSGVCENTLLWCGADRLSTETGNG